MTLTWLQWGDIPTWLAAIGTVGGLFYALRLFRREAQTGRQRDEDRLRELARFVAVWINEKGTLTMRNGGPEPAYDVGVYHSREEDLDPGESLLLLYQNPLLPPLTEIDTGASNPTPMGTQMFRLVFTDARGIRWVREGGGGLIRVDPKIDVGVVGAMAEIQKASGGWAHSPRYPG